MKASQIHQHFQRIGTWVNWERTNDVFLHGDPEAEVAAVAVGWIPTNDAIERAGRRGINLFITHEHCFFPKYAETPVGRSAVDAKRELLDRFGMTVLRCHDMWDRMPEVGIPDAWAGWLGFETEPRPVESFYKVCLTGGLTAGETARAVREKVGALGQDVVGLFGDPERRVERLAVGTGAITRLPEMLELKVDAVLATDDGFNTPNGGMLAVDMGLPMLVVNHCTAEKPGMMAMAEYLREQFPDAPVEYVDVALPCTHV